MTKTPEYRSEWEFLKSIGIRLGVPEEKILKEDPQRRGLLKFYFLGNTSIV